MWGFSFTFIGDCHQDNLERGNLFNRLKHSKNNLSRVLILLYSKTKEIVISCSWRYFTEESFWPFAIFVLLDNAKAVAWIIVSHQECLGVLARAFSLYVCFPYWHFWLRPQLCTLVFPGNMSKAPVERLLLFCLAAWALLYLSLAVSGAMTTQCFGNHS